jgi:hypothetical protein
VEARRCGGGGCEALVRLGVDFECHVLAAGLLAAEGVPRGLYGVWLSNCVLSRSSSRSMCPPLISPPNPFPSEFSRRLFGPFSLASILTFLAARIEGLTSTFFGVDTGPSCNTPPTGFSDLYRPITNSIAPSQTLPHHTS